jgi:hypothetical protein
VAVGGRLLPVLFLTTLAQEGAGLEVGGWQVKYCRCPASPQHAMFPALDPSSGGGGEAGEGVHLPAPKMHGLTAINPVRWGGGSRW